MKGSHMSMATAANARQLLWREGLVIGVQAAFFAVKCDKIDDAALQGRRPR